MRNQKITNSNLRQLDWAQQARARALRTMQAGMATAPVPAASSGWGTDVARTDCRSVHAYLAGKGDGRTTWWKFFSWAYCKVVKGADLERAMFAFHRFHHTLTLGRLEFAAAVVATASDIECDRVLVAIRRAATK